MDKIDKGYYETLKMSDFWPIKIIPHEHFEDQELLSTTNKGFINGHFMKHWHRSVEFFYVVNHGCTIWKNGHTRILQNGDLEIINSEEAHEFYDFQPGNQNGVSVILSYTFLKQLFPEFDNWYFIINQSHPKYDEFCQLLLTLKTTATIDNEWKQLEMRSLMYRLLYILTNYFRYDKDAVITPQTQKYETRCRMILKYINEHYNENLTLKAVAAEFGYNPEYFSRFFKEYVGKNLVQYIKLLRVVSAKNMLLKTDLKIADIALEVGEPDIKTFINDFKKEFVLTPLQYRKTYQPFYKKDRISQVK